MQIRKKFVAIRKNIKFIFVAGGVVSGVGKGVAASSIAKILQSRGLEVTAAKIDPYVNVDAGTMNPTEHGEVFVLDDGMECDQDMGNYERFLTRDLTRANYMTTGSVYLSVISKERNLAYGGKCVEVVPQVPLEVINNLEKAAKLAQADIIITEIGGTVGEYQNILFLEAVRMLRLEEPGNVLLLLVSYLPTLADKSEFKTKPTQYAVRALNAVGLHPDLIIARARVALDKKRKEKIALNCSVHETDIISAPDVGNIYEVPINFEKDKISEKILTKFNLKPKHQDLKEWRNFVAKIKKAKKAVKIGIVGKYFNTGDFILADSYISVIEAVKYAAYNLGRKPVIEWLNAEDFEPKTNKKWRRNLKQLKKYGGIIVPGGFGGRGVEGKIQAIKFCRENKIPFLGLCYGMQLAVIEFARDVAGMRNANTTEVDKATKYPVIDILPEQKINLAAKNYGATMRLGAYPAKILKSTLASALYKKDLISERHRHRYEVNPDYIQRLRERGMVFSGFSPDERLMEIMELPKKAHRFFVGCQFHPEFKSRPLAPHPLFLGLIKATMR